MPKLQGRLGRPVSEFHLLEAVLNVGNSPHKSVEKMLDVQRVQQKSTLRGL